MITKVQSFRTEDGKLFDNKADATRHSRFLELRGIVNRGLRCSGGISSFSVGDVVSLLLNNGEEIKATLAKYNRILVQLEKKTEPAA